MSDILEDPDAELEKGLKAEDHETAAYVLHALVKHLEAGGVVPKRLRGEGTAVGKMIEDERLNYNYFRFKVDEDARSTLEAIRAVTGES